MDDLTPDEIFELSHDILRASEQHFMGRDLRVVIYALISLAADLASKAEGISSIEALKMIRASIDEEIESQGD